METTNSLIWCPAWHRLVFGGGHVLWVITGIEWEHHETQES